MKLLLFISTLFTISTALSNTFVNVYLWKLEKNYILIGWFNFYQYLFIMIIFILAGKIAKNRDRVIILRIGVVILTVFYFAVLLLGNAAAKQYVVLGILLGIGQGFYWFAFHLLYFEITEPENRDVFNGWNGLLTSAGGIIAPFLSGWLIAKSSGLTGYRMIFFISLVIFAVAVISSFFFRHRQYKGDYRLIQVLKETAKNPDWRNILFAMAAQGGREGIILFLIGLLIYISTNSEFSLGTYTMLISAVSFFTYYIVGKILRREWRNRSMMIGSVMMAIVVIPMFLDIKYSTLLIYGIGTSIFAPLYFIPLTSGIFDKIGENEASASLRGEYIVLREIGLNLGRIVSTLFFIFFIKEIGIEYLRFLLLISGSLQIFTWYFMKSVRLP